MSPSQVKKETPSFEAKFCYGRFLYYPANQPARDICERLTNSKTLTKEQTAHLAVLGVQIKIGGDNGF